MATFSIVRCDECHSDKGVKVLTVAYGKKAWEVDLCEKCYMTHLGPLSKKGRRAERSSVKPQHRFKITEVQPNNL